MLRRFIIATDLSKASYALVECLGGLRAYGAREALLLQCLSKQQLGSVAFSYSTDYLEKTLEHQKEMLEKQGYEVSARIVPESPKREINRLALEEDYSFVVVGSHGHSLAQDVLLGGVATDVIQSAQRPVLVVRMERTSDTDPDCVRAARCNFGGHLLFPTDFSENADQAFPYVEQFVKGGVKRITLMHVQDQARIEGYLDERLETFNEIDRVRLERLKAKLLEAGDVEVGVELSYGRPFSEINKFIKEQDVNLVVMGSQGRGFVSEIFLGSVSHNIARQSPASVFLVPSMRTQASA